MLEAPTNSPEPGGLPPGLDAVVPGPALALAVAGIDRDRLSGEERVALLRARSRLRAHVEAQLIADIVAIFDAEVEEVGDVVGVDAVPRLAAAEIQAALTWTRRAAEFQVDFAWTLVELYPQVWEALDAGLIDLPKARVICNQTIHLDPETRNQVVEIALERAPTQTTGLLAARIRRLAIWVDPESAKRRYEGGLEERRVSSEANDDGTANLWGLNMSPAETQAAMRRINRLARGLKAIGDHRTMDQIRADVFLDLIRGRPAAEGTDRAVVDINVDLTTLAGLTETPGEIPGFGPVIADVARQVVDEQHDAEWRYTATNEQGAVVSTGTTRRRPDSAMRRRVQARSRSCVFPGCRAPATACDLDHNQAWSEGGPTRDDNLAPLCRHHHVIKHHGWALTRSGPGAYQLTSPLGVAHFSGPEPP